jgi:signal peptidase I
VTRERGARIAVATTGIAVLAAGLAVLRLRRHWLHVTVDGPSMLPTLSPGDRLLARRAPSAVLTGDVVVVRRPVGDRWPHDPPPRPERAIGPLMIKRVVAGPGDPLPALVAAGWDAPAGTPVPAGRYVLLGDNLDDSLDSRILGSCPAGSIVGVVPRLSPARAPAAARSSASGRPGPAPAARRSAAG